MGFADIERFLESRYPGRPVTLTSELGREIEAKANDSVIKAFGTSLMPRTLRILSPQSREFLRWRHSPVTKDRFEDLLGAEEQVWSELEDGIHAVGELLQTHSADGKFVLGDSPSNTDFFIAGYLQSAKVIHEEVFNRIVAYPGYHDIYDACLPYMEKKD